MTRPHLKLVPKTKAHVDSDKKGWRDCIFAPECEKLVGPRSHSTMCSNCSSGRNYWKHKPMRARLDRSKQLTKLQARMATLVEEKQHVRKYK